MHLSKAGFNAILTVRLVLVLFSTDVTSTDGNPDTLRNNVINVYVLAVLSEVLKTLGLNKMRYIDFSRCLGKKPI